MPEVRKRRSPRRELELPIRVFGTDFQGRDFVEDSTTLVVSRHGAKIQLARKLIPEQEIQILSQGNNREAPFRVVSLVGGHMSEVSFWGVECLSPDENIWEGAVPRPRPKPELRPRPQLHPKPRPELGLRPGLPLDRKLPPQLGSRLGPQVDRKLPPQLGSRLGPQLDPKLPPQLGSRLGPQLDPKLGSKLSRKDKTALQVMLRCANCGMRELVDLSERQIQHMRKSKGLLRDCPACGASSMWKGVSARG